VQCRVQSLDYSAGNPFTALLFNNPFGNKDRFTDDNGLQVYGNDVWIDNLTGLMYSTIPIAANNTWVDALTACEAFIDPLGNSDYHMFSTIIYGSLANFSPSSLIQDWIALIPTFNLNRYYWLSDYRVNLNSQNYAFRGNTQGATWTLYSATTTETIPYRVITQPIIPNP